MRGVKLVFAAVATANSKVLSWTSVDWTYKRIWGSIFNHGASLSTTGTYSSLLVRRGVATRTAMAPSLSMEDCKVDVTRHNFESILPLVKESLENCEFFAFDCELTGLRATDGAEDPIYAAADRYPKLKQSAEAFIVCQFGLSAFKRENDSYTARTFNFHAFPRAYNGFQRRFLSEPTALEFLAGHGFDFNKCIRDGVSYLPLEVRDAMLTREAWITRPERGPVEVSAIEDKDFMRSTQEQVQAWLASGDAPLTLACVNRWKRLLQYQIVFQLQKDTTPDSTFMVQKCGDGTWPHLLLTKGTQQEMQQLQEQKQQELLQELQAACGLSRVFEAMRDCGKPAVGHNPVYDIVCSLSCFVATELPPTYAEFKQLVQKWFPGGIYDTKYLAKQWSSSVVTSTVLGQLYDTLQGAALHPDIQGLQLPSVQHAAGFDKYTGVDCEQSAHEAGYDAFMTGAVMSQLLKVFADQNNSTTILKVAGVSIHDNTAAVAAVAASTSTDTSAVRPGMGDASTAAAITPISSNAAGINVASSSAIGSSPVNIGSTMSNSAGDCKGGGLGVANTGGVVSNAAAVMSHGASISNTGVTDKVEDAAMSLDGTSNTDATISSAGANIGHADASISNGNANATSSDCGANVISGTSGVVTDPSVIMRGILASNPVSNAADIGQAGGTPTGSARPVSFRPVEQYLGRINLAHRKLEYMSLFGEEQAADMSHVVLVGRLDQGWRFNDVVKVVMDAGLGKCRISQVTRSSCVIELIERPQLGPQAISLLSKAASNLSFVPYSPTNTPGPAPGVGTPGQVNGGGRSPGRGSSESQKKRARVERGQGSGASPAPEAERSESGWTRTEP